MSKHRRVLRFSEKCDNYVQRFAVFFACAVLSLVVNVFIASSALVDAWLTTGQEVRRAMLGAIGGCSLFALLAIFTCIIIAISQTGERYVGRKTRSVVIALFVVTLVLTGLFGAVQLASLRT